MLKYKLQEKGNPLDKTASKKFYATHISSGKKNLKDIGIDISQKSSLTRGDISNVLDNLVDQIPKYLLDGQTVKLGDLGSIRLSFSGDGADTPDDYNVSMIKNVKFVFTASSMLKDSISSAQFERVH